MMHTAPAQFIPSGVFPVIPKGTGVQWLGLNTEYVGEAHEVPASRGWRILRIHDITPYLTPLFTTKLSKTDFSC